MVAVAEVLRIEAGQRLVLDGVTWDQYVAMADALPDHAGLRMTFDGKRLELMTKSVLHEWFKELLGRLIPIIALEWNMPIRSGGEMTFRRRRVNRGLEPDQCYWIAHERQMRGRKTWDADIDPPPDLAVEIDVAHSSVNREAIYARLRVPELWRFDGEAIRVLVLTKAAKYVEARTSRAFPNLPVHELVPFLLPDEDRDETTMLREFIDWLRRF
jgi:Uma2 family endonuclease